MSPTPEPNDGTHRVPDGSHGIGYLLWGSCNYLEIVQKVAAQMKIDKKIVQTHNMAEIEQAILDKTMNEVASKLSSEERKEVEKILKEASKKYQSNSSAVLGSSSVVTTLISTIGRQATNQIIRKIMAKIATRFAAREAAKRGVTVATTAIPVVNVIMWGWTAIDLAGPAYRKIVPTVINTALLRLQLEDK